MDVRWQQVTCSGCGRSYQCTPEDDFYPPHAGESQDLNDGVCLGCLMRANGMDPETTPVTVLYAGDGTPADPRDTALESPGGEA